MPTPYQLRRTNSRTDKTDASDLSWPEPSLMYSDLLSEPEPYVSPPSTWPGTSAFQPQRMGQGSSSPTTRTHSPHSSYTARGSPRSTRTDSPRSYYTPRESPRSIRTDSPRLSYTANELPSPYLPTNSTSTTSTSISVPYTVKTVNSHKSRKNVLYPRRVHPPLPVTVSLELEHVSISHDVRFFLCGLFL